MQIDGLGWRTDIALLEISGSQVTDRGDHLVIRTPDNPTFWWGNFLLLAAAPVDPAQAEAWLAAFEGEFPEARHRTFGLGDAADGRAGDAFAALGLEVEVSTVMSATSVQEPPRAQEKATYRPLRNDADWEQQVQLSMVGEDIGHDRVFTEARAAQHRRLVEAGHGQWWAPSSMAGC